jgi:hypothetical protein
VGFTFSPLLCYYATLTAAATKTKPIGDDDDRRFTIIVNGGADRSAAEDGRVLPHFQQILTGASMPPCPIAAVF